MIRSPHIAPFASSNNVSILRARALQQRPSTERRAIQYAAQISKAPHTFRRRPQLISALRSSKRSHFSHPTIRSFQGKPVLQQSRSLSFVFKVAAWLGISVTVASAGIVGFFLYDASTYREDLSQRNIEISDLALILRTGGPKNLPIAEVLMDDEDDDEMKHQMNKPRLVILGGGWGSVALIKELRVEDYHVTVVSPTSYFLFTPMLPSATVGTPTSFVLSTPFSFPAGA